MKLRGWIVPGIAAAVVGLLGCDGCKEAPETAPDVRAVVAAADAGKEDTRDESLYEAKMMAQTSGTSVAVHLGDVSRSLAAEIEATAAKPQKPRRPKIQREAETGKLKKAQLNKVFNDHAGAMKKCYERVLKNEPGLAGKVRVELVISSSGSVRSAKSRGISLRDDTVQDCMERQAKLMKFPEPEGGALRVTKTYSFSPEF